MTGKAIAILGKGKTLEDALKSNADEFWAVTHAWRYVPEGIKVDKVFEPHPYEFLTRLEADKSKQHVEWLKQEHDFPIYMQKKYEEFPSSVEYPLKAIFMNLPRIYAKSSIALAMAMAIDYGYNIELYGIQMLEDSEWRYQRPNMLYWIGFAEGRGLKVHAPEESGLIKDKLLYGYDRTQWVDTDLVNKHIESYRKQARKAKEKLQYAVERLEKKPNDPDRQTRAEDGEKLVSLLQGAKMMAENVRDNIIPESGWLDRISVVQIRFQAEQHLKDALGNYNAAVGEYNKTKEGQSLQELMRWRARMYGYEGAKRALDKMIADIDLREPDMEVRV
jgi:hypothetical protein